MCGIAGVVGAFDDNAKSLTERMLASMQHRGPDQDGIWLADGARGIALGHRRLSIIDLSEAGRQPMIDAGTGAAITYNGECYNFGELRQELESLGRQFKSASDTEVVLAAYLEWGMQAIERLRGMFALAIWDPGKQRLVLARDRFGIKPLYYVQVAGQFIFASELRALLATDCVPRKIDPPALNAFLWHGFVPGPHTLVQGIRLLEAGTTLQVSANGELKQRQKYWQIPPHAVGDGPRSVAVARDELERAVEMRLVSDVPLGIFLSGGVDSSVVAALAQRVSARPISTFNIRFDEARYDESPYARTVAKQLGTHHHEVMLTERDFAERLDDAVASIDQPTFDAINTYFVSRAVREAGLTVALAGTGGDELFGGYSSFAELPGAKNAASMIGLLPNRARALLSRAVCRVKMGRGSEVPPQTRWGKLADLLGTKGDLVGLYQVSYALFSHELLNSLSLTDGASLRWGLLEERAAELAEMVHGEADLSAISMLELTSFVGERLLRDTDSASMASSLEVRVPLLDHVFVEALSRVPLDIRFEPLRKKTMLKEMLQGTLDPSVFEREKAGFELPLERWCRNLLSSRLRDTLRDVNLAHAVGLDGETVGRLLRAFEKGGAGIYWSRVWSVYILMNWCQRHEVYL